MFTASANFIEKHVDLLDSDPKRFFIELWESEMSQEEAAMVVEAVYQAGLRVHEERLQAFFDIAIHQVLKFASSTTSVSAMPLHDFLYGYMYNFVGFTFAEAETFILEQAYLWKDSVKIYIRQGAPIIERI